MVAGSDVEFGHKEIHCLVRKANLVQSFTYYVYFFSLHFWVTMCPSLGERTVSM